MDGAGCRGIFGPTRLLLVAYGPSSSDFGAIEGAIITLCSPELHYRSSLTVQGCLDPAAIGEEMGILCSAPDPDPGVLSSALLIQFVIWSVGLPHRKGSRAANLPWDRSSSREGHQAMRQIAGQNGILVHTRPKQVAATTWNT